MTNSTKVFSPEKIQLNPKEAFIPDWQVTHLELRKKGVTLRLLWMEYLESHSQGGEKLFVDYAGEKVSVIDPKTGEIREAEIFVAVLRASSYTYAEAQWHQDLPNWIGGQVRAYEFFEGDTEVLVPDNLRAAVNHPSRYDLEINQNYQEMAEHYGVAVIPARVRKPRDKSKAEVGVQNVERWTAEGVARLHTNGFSVCSN